MEYNVVFTPRQDILENIVQCYFTLLTNLTQFHILFPNIYLHICGHLCTLCFISILESLLLVYWSLYYDVWKVIRCEQFKRCNRYN